MKKLNLVLVAILALQIAVYAINRYVVKADYAPRTTVEGTQLFPDAKGDTIVKLELKQDGRTTEVKREGDKWLVASENNAAADVTACRDAATQLEKLAPGFIVSEQPEKHEQFEVTGKNALEVKATNSAGATVAHFVLGKTTPDWRGVYLRMPPDSRDVMKIDSNIRALFCKNDTQPGSWRDKTLFTADAKNVRTIELVRPEETITIERKLSPSKEAGKENELVATEDDEWTITQPITHSLDKYTGSQMARNLATLKCDGFAPPGKSAADCGLEPPEVKAVAKLADGSTLELEIGKEDAGKVFARKPGGEIVTVPSYQFYNFKKKSTDFKPPEPAAVETPAEPPATPDESKPEEKKPEEKPAEGGG